MSDEYDNDEYIYDLISDMLDAQDKEDTPENRQVMLSKAINSGYINDIAKEH